ncbi:hypothetical protein [Oceanicoccus sp. KOV_DT_Chl]|uniref:hypothetical protein n=1 Tax=Oceanicoccus sp. KOV_DT_Chl TaxID=1904639 RepID=UPI00135675B9|nr:hypothetical protein [Oceanicoccus sp. KOV_DT_Chl]
MNKMQSKFRKNKWLARIDIHTTTIYTPLKETIPLSPTSKVNINGNFPAQQ